MNQLFLVAIIGLAVAIATWAALKLTHLSIGALFIGLAGTITGLLVGALLSLPLGRLPGLYGDALPLVFSLLITVITVGVFINQRQAILGNLPFLKSHPTKAATKSTDQILVDTSVIIDGRIADIAKSGFIRSKLLVPRFVLAELQNVADSDDPMRRNRGRRGLEMLNSLRQTADLAVEIIEEEVPEIKEVDAKLVHLGQKLSCDILTTDYNLNRVAQIEGVRVLNINELANAIRPVVLPGEELAVKIVQAGKERNQGVGYLPDGTMIVVEQGDKLIGQEVLTEVTRVFQTVAGKMIFAAPRHPIANGNGNTKNRRRGRNQMAQSNPNLGPSEGE